MAGGDVTRLAMGGDWVAVGRMPEAVISRPETTAALNILRTADIAYVNLETPLTKRGVPAEKVTVLRADPAVAEDLVMAGVDIVGLANNHMMDHGLDGLADTLATLDRSGISYVGAGENLEAARRSLVLEGPGGSVGFLASASTLPPGFAAAAERPGVAPIHATAALVMEPRPQEQPGMAPTIITFAQKRDLEATVEAVRALKARADFAIVSQHWGVTGQDAIMDYEKEIGHALIDAGADLIYGHHPHRLHGIEFYRGKPIFYSVANFLFEPLPPWSNNPNLSFRGRMTHSFIYSHTPRDSVVVDLQVRGGQLQKLALLPILLDGDGYPMLRPDRADHLASLLSGLSIGMEVTFVVEGGEVLVTPA